MLLSRVIQASGSGGGVYHNGSRRLLTLINTILWNNNRGDIRIVNDTSDTETVNLCHSLIEGGTNVSTAALGIRLVSDDITNRPIEIIGESFIINNPGLGTSLASNGSEIDTISI